MKVTQTKKLTKLSPKASVKITVWQHTCQKCSHSWISKYKDVQSCANKKCRSPNWNKDYSGMKK